jgi:hypothetical protein
MHAFSIVQDNRARMNVEIRWSQKGPASDVSNTRFLARLHLESVATGDAGDNEARVPGAVPRVIPKA